jgi:hypothetical protein
MLPVGLIYNDMNLAESWMVGSDQQLVKLFDGINLRISPRWQPVAAVRFRQRSRMEPRRPTPNLHPMALKC